MSGSVARTSLVCHNCTRTGSTMTGMPSWASGFGPLGWLVVATTHFEFDQGHPGVMKMKTLPSDTNPTEMSMLRAGVAIKDIQEAYQSQVMPPVISPQWIVPDAVTVPVREGEGIRS